MSFSTLIHFARLLLSFSLVFSSPVMLSWWLVSPRGLSTVEADVGSKGDDTDSEGERDSGDRLTSDTELVTDGVAKNMPDGVTVRNRVEGLNEGLYWNDGQGLVNELDSES